MPKSSNSRKGGAPSSAVQQRTRIPIEIVLPEVLVSDDPCIGRLIDVLSSEQGIDSSHLMEAREGAASELCIHYDPTLTSVVKVRELAELAGTQIHQRYGHILLSAKPMHAGRASAMEARLIRVPGVLESVVSPNGTIRVEFDRDLTSEKLVHRALGKWPPTSHDPGGGVRLNPATATTSDAHLDHDHSDHEERGHAESGHTHGGIFGKNTELVFASLSGMFLLAGWLGEAFFDLPNGWTLALFIGAYFFGGFYSLKEMVEKIRSRKFEIDFLMLVAATGAASIGAWSEGALLLFLFSVGHSLEGYAMGRAKRAIEALADLSPRTATVRRDAVESEIPVEDLVVGDIVIVKPDERLAADGFVVAGESSVDQAPITGESIPVDKVPTSNIAAAAADPESVPAEHRVFAGTINQAGALEIQVTKIASENTLARLVTMVNEAETRISPTQRFTKKFERYFVPAVVGGVVLLLFSPLVLDESFTAAFYRAMAVLVAASPCALAIATPSAVLSGIARAARGGILVKGGAPLENLGKLDSIAFDKTGTLTEGKPVVTDVRPAEGALEADLLRTAVAVENLSKHPLAQAVVRYGKSRLTEIGSGNQTIPQATDLRSITGRGIQALVEGDQVYIGKDDLFTEIEGSALPGAIRSTVTSLEAAGRTTMIVRRGDHFLGVLGLMDTPRDAAKRTISALRQLGVKRMIMISGDNQTVASAVAKAVGLDEARGDLMPEDKVAEIRQLASATGVAMVGDGVNDAPAMAAANVGIAMGAAGSDVALETADVALMADNLDHLPLAIGLSRATSRIIRQNLWMSLGMVAFLVPATVLGLGIGPAVMLHEGSTLVVVFNALRLLAYSN